MKILILCFFIPACLGFDFDCLKGPDFWCASFANAEKCHKITECFMKNKKGMSTQVNSISSNSKIEVPCKLCLDMVNFIESQFRGLTQQQLITSLDSIVCDKLKGESMTICRFIVNQYGPVIYQLIKNNASPQKICNLFTACNGNEAISFNGLFEHLRFGNNDTCAKCKEFFAILESLVSKVTPDEIKYLLDALVCSQLPSELRETCKLLIDGYATQLYNLIKSLLDGNRMCPLFHLCSSVSSVRSTVWSCQTCLDVVGVLKKDLINVSESDLENFAKTAACSKLSFIARGICNDYVGSLTPVLYNDIHSSLTPQQICSKDQICASRPQKRLRLKSGFSVKCEICELSVAALKKLLSNKDNVDRLTSFIKLKICKHLKSLDSKCSNAVDNYGELFINFVINHMNSEDLCRTIDACALATTIRKHGVKNLKGIECEGCKLVVGRIKEFLSDPTRETFLKNLLKNRICTIVPSITNECQQTVDEYFNIVINFIISELDVDMICHIAGMCPTLRTSGPECAVCELVMSEVISIVTNNHSEEVISNFVNSKVCSHLKGFETECVNFVQNYLPLIFAIARSNLNSKILCSELHLCSLITNEKIRLILKNSQSNSLKCDICVFVVNETQHILTDPTLQTDLENFLKNVICSHFGLDKQKCINSINQYFSFVVNIVVEFLNPSLCSELRLCNTTSSSTKHLRHPMMKIAKGKKTHGCSLCSKFYRYLHTITEQNRNVNTVLGLVHICDEVDPHEKSKCLKQFKNFDSVIRAFNKSKNIHEFCKMTKMCKKKRNVGENPCSWGPGFWCISRQHALACGPGAVKHCEMSVWSNIPIL